MTRTIEFRAWEPNLERMIYNIAVYPHGNGFGCDGEEFKGFEDDLDDDWVYGTAGWWSCCNGEIMQWTGLKDKNGKKVFEGDIVRRKHHVTIEFQEDIDFIVYNNACFWLNNAGSALWLHGNHVDYLEVIGSIHTTPELMKEGE